jgi:hypothetical protein
VRRINKHNFGLAKKESNPGRTPLTIETNFSLKIPGQIHPGSTLDSIKVNVSIDAVNGMIR